MMTNFIWLGFFVLLASVGPCFLLTRLVVVPKMEKHFPATKTRNVVMASISVFVAALVPLILFLHYCEQRASQAKQKRMSEFKQVAEPAITWLLSKKEKQGKLPYPLPVHYQKSLEAREPQYFYHIGTDGISFVIGFSDFEHDYEFFWSSELKGWQRNER